MRISDWSSDVCSSDLIPLIGITSKAKSVLGKASDIVLVLPPVEEACPMGLAPTTSTTMSLALGDALAVALMERKGFNRDHYRVFHPGGRLGKQLIKVGDLMHAGPEMPLVDSGTPLRSAERRGGKECVSQVCSRWSPSH